MSDPLSISNNPFLTNIGDSNSNIGSNLFFGISIPFGSSDQTNTNQNSKLLLNNLKVNLEKKPNEIPSFAGNDNTAKIKLLAEEKNKTSSQSSSLFGSKTGGIFASNSGLFGSIEQPAVIEKNPNKSSIFGFKDQPLDLNISNNVLNSRSFFDSTPSSNLFSLDPKKNLHKDGKDNMKTDSVANNLFPLSSNKSDSKGKNEDQSVLRKKNKIMEKNDNETHSFLFSDEILNKEKPVENEKNYQALFSIESKPQMNESNLFSNLISNDNIKTKAEKKEEKKQDLESKNSSIFNLSNLSEFGKSNLETNKNNEKQPFSFLRETLNDNDVFSSKKSPNQENPFSLSFSRKLEVYIIFIIFDLIFHKLPEDAPGSSTKGIKPLLQDLSIPPLRYELDLKKPGQDIDMIPDNEIFTKINDSEYFNQNKQEFEMMKTFKSKPVKEMQETWLKNIKCQKYQELFEIIVKKVDTLYIDIEEKNKFLEFFEKIMFFYESEIGVDDKNRRELNLTYEEKQEDTLIFEETKHYEFELEKNKLKLAEEEKIKNQQLLENTQFTEKIEIDKNEIILKISKEIEDLEVKNKEEEKEIKSLELTLNENNENLKNFENNLTILKKKSKEDSISHVLFIENMKVEINDLNNSLKGSVYDLAKLNKMEQIFDKNINVYKNKIKQLNENLLTHEKNSKQIEDELARKNLELQDIDKQKILLEEKKISLDTKLEEKNTEWNRLNLENRRLLIKTNEINEEKLKNEGKNQVFIEQKSKKNEQIKKDYINRKQRIQNLRKEINVLNHVEKVDYSKVANETKEEVEKLRKKVVELEIRKKLISDKNKLRKSYFSMNPCFMYVLVLFILILIALKFCVKF